MNKETLEEAAAIGKFAEKKYLERLNNFQSIDFKDGVFEGAKWQQERMYSEEEVEKQKLEFAIGLLKVIEQPNGDLLGNKIKQQIIILEQKLSEL